jgi:hypothetical protein
VTEFERLYRRGIREVSKWYRLAIASQIRGEDEDANEAWEKYGEALGWTLTIAALTGQAEAHKATPRKGEDWQASDWPDKKPQRFATWAAGQPVAGPWWAAIFRFRRRIPRSWATVQKTRLRMSNLARKIAQSESREAIQSMTKRLEGLRSATSNSFVLKGATKAQAKRIQELLAKSVEEGSTAKGLKTGGLSGFIRRAQVEGVIGMTAARMETVYRTNVSSVYNEETLETMDDPKVQVWAPLLELVEVHDRRTRGAPGGVYKAKGQSANPGKHWQMDGYIETAERIRQQGLTPPNGYNCRGGLLAVTFEEAESKGFVKKDGTLDRGALDRYNAARQRIIDRGEYPDPGFKR